jgi:hypothetical protein
LIIIETGRAAGISFYYPLGTGAGLRWIRVIPWDRYKRNLGWLASISLLQCATGLLLLNEDIYTDGLFNVFAAGNIVFGFLRIWIVRASDRVMLSAACSIRRAPFLVGVDFSGFFVAIALMDLVYINHASSGLAKAYLEIGVLGLILLAIFPLANLVAFSLGFGRAPKKNTQ